MALSDDYAAAYSVDLALNETNPDNPEATSNDTARLLLAANTAEGYFETYVGISYDSTDKRHLGIAVEGVHRILQITLAGDELSQRTLGDWWRRLERLGTQLTRFIPTPQTSSILEPTPEPVGTRPVFDREHMGDYLLRPPRDTGFSQRDFRR